MVDHLYEQDSRKGLLRFAPSKFQIPQSSDKFLAALEAKACSQENSCYMKFREASSAAFKLLKGLTLNLIGTSRRSFRKPLF